MQPHECNYPGCKEEGFEVSDWYGIFAGYWCDEHEDQAPGQWEYNASGELSPYEMYGEDDL